MPNIVTGNSSDYSFTGKIKSYSYPLGKDFSPKGSISKKIVEHIMRLARESASAMSSRHPYWRIS